MQKETVDVVVIENLESLKIKFWAKHCQRHIRSKQYWIFNLRVYNVDFVHKRGEVKNAFLAFYKVGNLFAIQINLAQNEKGSIATIQFFPQHRDSISYL